MTLFRDLSYIYCISIFYTACFYFYYFIKTGVLSVNVSSFNSYYCLYFWNYFLSHYKVFCHYFYYKDFCNIQCLFYYSSCDLDISFSRWRILSNVTLSYALSSSKILCCSERIVSIIYWLFDCHSSCFDNIIDGN